jgi:hypothetical protein
MGGGMGSEAAIDERPAIGQQQPVERAPNSILANQTSTNREGILS